MSKKVTHRETERVKSVSKVKKKRDIYRKRDSVEEEILEEKREIAAHSKRARVSHIYIYRGSYTKL